MVYNLDKDVYIQTRANDQQNVKALVSGEQCEEKHKDYHVHDVLVKSC